jgi:hypothetical protein
MDRPTAVGLAAKNTRPENGGIGALNGMGLANESIGIGAVGTLNGRRIAHGSVRSSSSGP